MSSSRPARNLPASIVLPPTKKRKQEDENVREDDDDDDEAEEQRAATARAAAASATASSHNTPSPSFFATSSPRRTDARITFNNPPPTITPKYLTRVRHAKQLVIISSNPKHNEKPYKTEKDMDTVEVIEDGGMVIGHDGLIVAVGTDEEIAAQYDAPNEGNGSTTAAGSSPSDGLAPALHNTSTTYLYELDARDACILPGLVDGHTHPVWAGDRVHEFSMKLAGASYMDIHKSGGGIGFTVNHTRNATESELLELFLQRLKRALRQGTTLLEAKSGYGLDWENELKMLRVIESASKMQPMTLVANYCGAHSVPKGSTAAEATHDIIHRQIPALVEARKKENLTTLSLIDVFCETGVFELADSRAILEAGQKAGLGVNFHGDELSPIKAAEMGAEIGAVAISHLEHVSEAGMNAMAASGVVATLLPTTAYILRIKPPPAKKLLEHGVCVALGTDFNPNAHCLSLPTTMNLACVYMGMTLPQALNAATINAAGSLQRAHTDGSLAKGKRGNFILLEASRWEHLIYQMTDPPIAQVWCAGKLAWRNRDIEATNATSNGNA